MRRIAFVIDQKQDFYLALSFLFLIKERTAEVKNQMSTLALITNEDNVREFEPYLHLFDQHGVIGHCAISPNPLTVRKYAKRLAGKVKNLSLNEKDVVIAFSFRQFFMNVLIKNLIPRPKLVKVRKCDYEVDAQCTRKKPIVSLYRNLSNLWHGYSLMKYRWHPETDRIFTYFFMKNPYHCEFCMNPVQALREDGRQIPYPFPVLREHAGELGATPGQPGIVVLGERYPFYKGMDMEGFLSIFNRVLDFIRREFPQHKLIFKPRGEKTDMNLGFNLERFTVAFQDISLESLLLRYPGVEKVISFKSSGSFIAALYGREGYLLYPMLNLPESILESQDAYYSPHAGSVNFVHELEDLRKTQAVNPDETTRKVKQMSQRFIDALLS